MATEQPWQFWIDTGGTFTDVLAETPGGELRRLKVLSTGAVRGEIAAIEPDGRLVIRGLPATPADFFAGYSLRRVADGAEARVRSWTGRAAVVEKGAITWRVADVVDLMAGEEAPVLAMRVLTGTPLGARLPPAELRLATTRGTNALLEGKGARVAFFVTAGFGDLLRIGDQRRPDLFALRVEKPAPLHGPVVEVVERLAADGSVVTALEENALRAAAIAVLRGGVDVAAVALLHSHRNAAHERAVAAVLREVGFSHVSVSAEIAPFIKIVPRAETTVVDAVLAPVMERYLSGVARAAQGARFFVMTSAGGLVPRASYRPKDSLLSGPAGGVAGAAAIARAVGCARVLTFDMGGTSTDVARWAGDFDYRFQHAVGPARVFAPALRVESVAAGGGSICRFDGAALVVGPESAGAAPGPACYGAGGPLTLTDVNLLLGRLDGANFAVPVSTGAAEARLQEVLEQIHRARGTVSERRDVLEGFLAIANERMAEAIREISVREGFDPAGHALLAFGGAGGLHACAIAEQLGVPRILFPANSGLLSAAGLREAVPERFAERQILRPLAEVEVAGESLFAQLAAEARDALVRDGLAAADVQVRRAELELRFTGQEAGLVRAAQPVATIAQRFAAAHEERFGYVPAGRIVEVVTARVIVSPRPRGPVLETFPPSPGAVPGASSPALARDDLAPGAAVAGPVLITDRFSTLYVAAGWRAVVGSRGTIAVERTARGASTVTRPEWVDLELFTCRFTSLVEEMGGLLQRCALSVNVKERLDFSCALLDARGELVANAPHIPVHLGALGLCVRLVREAVSMAPGDVVVTNHPAFGGSHLPDVTLVAPVHASDGTLLGYVANRAHHAEIGGTRPGSMPPQARTLAEEGVVLAPFHLVRGGTADWDGLRHRLVAAPYPSRAVAENIADLHAQLAAIRRGVAGLTALGAQHGTARLQHFMDRLRQRAATVLAEALARLPLAGSARDALDDGSPVVVRIARAGARLQIDFSGSGPVHPGNLNATAGIVRSAVLYVLRVLAGRTLPLNEGLLRDVELIVPPGLLAPDFVPDPRACPAVAGGNVETSQRIVDVLLAAWGVAACSQGTMNNVLLGAEGVSYYETIGGGTGAGPVSAGADAVHSHMTNTAITDPEIFETRLPVRLVRFAIRLESGGRGKFRGGDGIERRWLALAPCALSVLTQRRNRGAPGAAGGEAGVPGAQRIVRAAGPIQVLGAIDQAELEAGDEFVILTPGGGGWGGRDAATRC